MIKASDLRTEKRGLLVAAWILLAGISSAISADTDGDVKVGPLNQQNSPQFSPQNCDKWEARTHAMTRSDDTVERELGQLLQQPELSFCQTLNVPVKDEPDTQAAWFDLGPELAALAQVLQWIAIAALIALVIWLVSKLQPGRWLKNRDRPPGKAMPANRRMEMVGDDGQNKDVLNVAEQAWHSGDRRGALSLLYRGAIIRIWPDQRRNLARTEREVISALQKAQAPDALLQTMHSLIRLWQQSAWAHRMPSDAEFKAICERWTRTFSDVDRSLQQQPES